MCANRKKGLLLAAVSLLFACPVWADTLWLERGDATTVRAYRGELHGQRSVPLGDKIRAFTMAEKNLPLAEEEDHLLLETQTEGDVRFVVSKKAGEGELVVNHAKYGRSELKAVNDLELLPTEAGGNTFKLIWKGREMPASRVTVQTSEGWQRTLFAAEDGTVSLSTPFAGLYVLEVSTRVNGEATVDGEKFSNVRHVATLSFEVEP